VEGDSLTLIKLLKSWSTHDNLFDFFITIILDFVSNSDFFSRSFVKSEGNRVAHDLAH